MVEVCGQLRLQASMCRLASAKAYTMLVIHSSLPGCKPCNDAGFHPISGRATRVHGACGYITVLPSGMYVDK